jgi:signal peptidase II
MIKRKYLILLAVQGLIVSLDQLTKFLIVSAFHTGESVAVIPSFFNITFVRNSGAAFGILSDLNNPLREPFFLIVPGLTLAAILYIFTKMHDRQMFSIYGLSLIIGGALGNIVDRVRIGTVIDFLDFHWQNKYHFPAFNVADSAITVGAVLLIISMVLEKDLNQAT